MTFRLKKHILLVFLSLGVLIACGQERDSIAEKKRDNKVSLDPGIIINRLQAKVELQGLEIGVLKSLQKVDSMQYEKDSLIISYIAKNGKILKTVKQVTRSSGREDSIITYYNKNGLLNYQEWWHDGYTKENSSGSDKVWVKTKLTYSRHEYDNRNRLTRRLKLAPDYRMEETAFVYDVQGKAVESRKWIEPTAFWGSVMETLKK